MKHTNNFVDVMVTMINNITVNHNRYHDLVNMVIIVIIYLYMMPITYLYVYIHTCTISAHNCSSPLNFPYIYIYI